MKKEQNLQELNEQSFTPISGSCSIISGNCFWRHKWTKWEQYNVNMMLIADTKIQRTQLRQKRICLRCGKMELEDLEC